MLPQILTIKINFHTNYYKLMHKFRSFVNLLQIILRLLENYQKLSYIVQSGGLLGRLLKPLLKTGLPVIENVLKKLAKSVLISFELTAAASATDAALRKKMFGPGFTTLIISNEEMNDIMNIVKSLEESW